MNEGTQASLPDPQSLRFREAVAELEGIVRDLEGGELDLEESLEKYGRGVALLTACRRKLDDAEQKVTMLMGELETDEEPSAEAGSSAGMTPVDDLGGEEIPF